MAEVKLNWASAEVDDGRLSVDLEGDVTSDWKRSFEGTNTLLRGGDWGKVQVKKDKVRVSDVPPGSEEKLRHHLESVVEQANADVRPPEAEGEERAGDGEEEADDASGEAAERESEDARMTDAFRAFAEGAEGQQSTT